MKKITDLKLINIASVLEEAEDLAMKTPEPHFW